MTQDPHLTVEELIAKLQQLPPKALAYIDHIDTSKGGEQVVGYIPVTSAGLVGQKMVSIGL